MLHTSPAVDMTPLSPRSHQSRRRSLPVRRQPACAVPDQPDTGVLSHSVSTEIFPFPSSVSFGCIRGRTPAIMHLKSALSPDMLQTHCARYLLCRHHLERLRCLFQFQSALPDLLFQSALPDLVLVAVLSQRVHPQSGVLDLILDLISVLCGAPERACVCRPIFALVFAVP